MREVHGFCSYCMNSFLHNGDVEQNIREIKQLGISAAASRTQIRLWMISIHKVLLNYRANQPEFGIALLIVILSPKDDFCQCDL